jgi:hypothetical protein
VPVASPRSLHESRTVHGGLSASGTTLAAVLASLRRWRGPEWFPDRALLLGDALPGLIDEVGRDDRLEVAP